MNRIVSIEVLNEIIQNLPSCSCGGQFLPNTAPKCAYCRNDLIKIYDPIKKLSDPHAMILEGSFLITEIAV